MYRSIILPGIENDLPAIREKALSCFGLYCLSDRDMAKRHVHLFWKIVQVKDEEPEVHVSALKVLIFEHVFYNT